MLTITREFTGRALLRSLVAVASLFIVLAAFAAPAFAQPFQDPVQGLARVGPVTQTHGYPDWYQDKTGITLELCVPKSQLELDESWCGFGAEETAFPESFPNQWAEEHFYWMADARLGDARLVLGLEATFAQEIVKPGDQVVFGRLRLRYDDVPASGTYTFYTPYGKFVFPNVPAGERIIQTFDIGFACPAGQFDCALTSHVGPFLLASNTPGGPELPPVFGPGGTYIASPGRQGPVTGSPLEDYVVGDGTTRNPNIFRIEGPGGLVVETTSFSLTGRLYTGPVPGEVNGQRATYTVNGNTADIDVFATAFAPITPRNPGSPLVPAEPPVLAFFPRACGGPDGGPYVSPGGSRFLLNSADPDPYYWRQVAGLTALPTHVCLEDTTARNASGQTVSTFSNVPLTDLVRITQAVYDPEARTLTVSAFSSDPAAELSVGEFGGVIGAGAGTFTQADLDAPPSRVTVNSLMGGRADLLVSTGIPVPPIPACSYSVLGSPQTLPHGGGSGDLTVTASGGSCAWAASSSEPWLTVSPPAGAGSATVTYTAAPNDLPTSRTAMVTVAGSTVFITQAGTPQLSCTYTLQPASATVPGERTTGNTFSVTASEAACEWTAISNNGFITITDGSTGTGNGTVTYTVNANTTAFQRTGTITVGDQTFTVTQEPPALLPNSCSADAATLNPTEASFPAAGPIPGNTITLTFSGTGPDGNPCTWQAVSDVAWLVLSANSVSGSGDATITYRVNNYLGAQPRTGTMTIAGQTFTVNQAGAIPVVSDDSYATGFATPLDVAAPGVLGNDGGSNGLRAVLVTTTSNGTLVLNTNGSFTYTPDASFSGTDTFVYRATNLVTESQTTATVTISVGSAPNSPPVAVNDTMEINEDEVLTFPASDLLANDSDPDGGTLTVTSVQGALGGTVALSSGIITFTPVPNTSGTASFAYTVADGQGGTAQATVTITILPVNDAPVGFNDFYQVDEDATLNVPASAGVLNNDTDVDGPALSAVLVNGPASGTLALNPDGSFTYTPAPNVNGPVSFTYRASDGELQSNVVTVSINILPVPDAPVAVDDTFPAAQLNVTNAFNLVANDFDPDGGAVGGIAALTLTSSPAGSAPVYAINGQFLTFTTTTPGNYTFTYRAVDINGSTLSDNTATVSITVVGVVETITITQADYRVRQDRWVVGGNANPRSGQILEITYYLPGSVNHGASLGLATVAGNGNWSIDARGAGIIAETGAQVRVQSSLSSVVQFAPVNIR